jgi:hypothetical protein
MAIRATTSRRQMNRRDPTRSAGLRKEGRAIVTRRVHHLHQRLRYSIQDEDVAGLRRSDNVATRTAFINWVESVSHKLARAENMIEYVIQQALLTPPDWPRELMERAVQRGIDQVEQELSTSLGHLDIGEVHRLHASSASNELRGIAGETERRLLRHVVRALETKASPEALMRDARTVLEKITKLRLNVMINTSVVGAINAGKLFGYKAAGITQVGIDPEWLPRQHMHDAKKAKKKTRGKARKKSPEAEILERALGIERSAALEELASLVEETVQEEVLVNILTAGDDLVCEDCQDIAADGPYDIDKARDLIPAHPNCRCAFVPWDDKRFAAIQEQVEAEQEEFE